MKPASQQIEMMKILLVEDNPSDVELIVSAFSNGIIPNKINIASNGEEALNYLYNRAGFENAESPNVILLDLNLPRQNGLEILEIIKSDNGLRSIPVVIFTSSEAQKDILKSYNSHANCYIVKPVDVDKFSGTIRKIEDFWLGIVKLPPQKTLSAA